MIIYIFIFAIFDFPKRNGYTIPMDGRYRSGKRSGRLRNGENGKEALRQIEEKDYQANLIAKGIPEKRIRKYRFAFCGKRVLIGRK